MSVDLQPLLGGGVKKCILVALRVGERGSDANRSDKKQCFYNRKKVLDLILPPPSEPNKFADPPPSLVSNKI